MYITNENRLFKKSGALIAISTFAKLFVFYWIQ